MEVPRRQLGKPVRRQAAYVGEHICGVGDVSGFVPFATKWNGSEIRRVGLHEQPVGWKIGRDAPEVMGFWEGQNAGEAHKAADGDGLFGECAAGAEAVQKEVEVSSPALFFLKDFQGVVIGIPGVDADRQAGGAGGTDLHAGRRPPGCPAARDHRSNPGPLRRCR